MTPRRWRQRGTAQVGGSPEIDNRYFAIKTSIATFFFEARGAKKKVIKKETPFWGVSPSAEGEEASAASTCANF